MPGSNTFASTSILNVNETDDGTLVSEGTRGPCYELGEWFWLSDKNENGRPVLMCITAIGSNYYQLTEPSAPHQGVRFKKVHHKDAHYYLTHEPNPSAAIQLKINEHQEAVAELMHQVQELTKRLGLAPSLTQMAPESQEGENNRALAVMSEQTDVKAYEASLVKAKEKDLPELFDALKHEQGEVARWLGAELLPLEAQSNRLKKSVKNIDSKIFNVSLYAGLCEKTIQIQEGDPAPMGTKVHVMQRRLYMDEECLLNYRHGGMEFHDIGSFDRWLLEPENLQRILPFERCIVAMRVRRTDKERPKDGSLQTVLINIRLAEADRTTFLYMRNGDNVYRLTSDQDFGAMIFPAKSVYDPAEPMMVKTFCGRVDGTMTVREFEERAEKTRQWRSLYEQWFEDNPFEVWREKLRNSLLKEWEEGSVNVKQGLSKEQWVASRMECMANKTRWTWENPYDERRLDGHINEYEWKLFDSDNLEYDIIAEHFACQIEQYNRIALVIQGLFDRSKVFHPHAGVRTWEPVSFSENIVLVYDGSDLLPHGDAPDIEEYIARCNESLGAGCVTVGQEKVWLWKEAKKENTRVRNALRGREIHTLQEYRPYGNPGPGALARIGKWKPRAKEAVFSWYREKLTRDPWSLNDEGLARATLTVEAKHLFNCDAYELGDYKQFFQDPRTRADYLKWAPMLLMAEEYKAGTLKPQEPDCKDL